MKKPVKIEHVLCGETWGYTYLWAPLEKTSEDIQQDATLAAERHLKAIKDFEKVYEHPDRRSRMEDCPDNMTIAEAKQFIALQEACRREYDRQKCEAGRSFGSFMCELGYRLIWDFGEDEVDEATVYWGHQHGVQIDASQTKSKDIDVKIPSFADDDDEDIFGLI